MLEAGVEYSELAKIPTLGLPARGPSFHTVVAIWAGGGTIPANDC